jgi:LysM repeat protein
VNNFNDTVWKSNSRFISGVYRTIVTNSGELSILNRTGHSVWTFQGCDNDQTIHNIREKDTCYDVAIVYKVPLKSLTDSNPKINCNNLQIGHSLCIPKKTESIVNRNLRLFNDFKASKVSSSDECWSECVSTSGCLASSFFSEEKDIENNCYLFKEGFATRKNLGWITQSYNNIYYPICFSGKEYTIKKDDTCYKISNIYQITVDALLREDFGINCDYLPIGYTLCIPDVLFKLRARANNNFITVNSNSNLIASETSLEKAETFEIIPLTSTLIALKSVSKGMFVKADDYGNKELVVNSNVALEWETFEFVDLSDGTRGIKALVNGKYITAENQGNSPLIANRNSIGGAWEAFEMINA